MIKEFDGHKPAVHPSCYISENSLVIGRVTLGAGVSVWPGCVLRGDIEDIVVREGTNLQDGAILHTADGLPVAVGRGVTVGHRAVLHGCMIGDNCLVGMGAVVLDGASVGENSIIGAGCVVTERQTIPAGSLVLGVPGRIAGRVGPEGTARILGSAAQYIRLAAAHAASAGGQR